MLVPRVAQPPAAQVVNFPTSAIALPWHYHGTTMALPWHYHGIQALPYLHHTVLSVLEKGLRPKVLANKCLLNLLSASTCSRRIYRKRSCTTIALPYVGTKAPPHWHYSALPWHRLDIPNPLLCASALIAPPCLLLEYNSGTNIYIYNYSHKNK